MGKFHVKAGLPVKNGTVGKYDGVGQPHANDQENIFKILVLILL